MGCPARPHGHLGWVQNLVLDLPLALQAAVDAHLAGLGDTTAVSISSVRLAAESRLGLPAGGLRDFQHQIKAHCLAYARALQAAHPVPAQQSRSRAKRDRLANSALEAVGG